MRKKLSVFIQQETYTYLLNLAASRRKQDRKTTMDDIVECAIKEYAMREKKQSTYKGDS